MSNRGVPQKNGPLRILLETGDGRSASAILENGFLQHCLDRGAEVHVLSPGACSRPFVEGYKLPGTRFTYLSVEKATQVKHHRLLRQEKRIGNVLQKCGLRRVRHHLWQQVGERLTAADGAFMKEVVQTEQPDCFVTAHVNQGFSRGLTALCHSLRIPTVGNIFSWDHPYYPQPAKTRTFTCWSQAVKADLVNIKGYRSQQIEIIGAPVFDTYFQKNSTWTRKQLCERMNLEPNRPILLFATLGQMKRFWDETGTFRAFLTALDKARLPGPPQVVLRLHPISIDHYFDEFRKRRDVTFSRYSRYVPCMRWCPSKEEVVLAGNLLRHADVCISPGSTMSVEAAIFDTPSIVPTFNPNMAEEYRHYFQRNWLNKHFRILVDKHAAGLADSADTLIAMVRRALAEPAWLAEGRKFIRENLLGPLDGKATERLAEVVVRTARAHRKHKNGR